MAFNLKVFHAFREGRVCPPADDRCIMAAGASEREEARMTEPHIREMLDGMCRAAEAFDGRKFASFFAEDGVYHDDFYGEFAGRERIAELINAWFFKHARDMRWDMIEPVFDGERLYVRYVFS